MALPYFFERIPICFENLDGLGSFGSPIVIGAGGGHVDVKDLNQDGVLDVLKSGPNSIVWFKNQADFEFGEAQVVDESNFSNYFAIAVDLDGDNDNDIVSSNRYLNEVAWFENIDGTGSFGNKQIISDHLSNASSVFSCDLDGDGDLDIISTSPSDNKIVWFNNVDGLGTFDEEIIISFSSGVTFVLADDVDNDGDNDVITRGQNAIIVYLNNGLGNFNYQAFGSYYSTSKLAEMADLDLDGDRDLLASNGYEGLAWFKNYVIDDGTQIIQGNVFWDENENGIKDDFEVGLNNQAISIVPSPQVTFPSIEGYFKFSAYPTTYSLSCQPIPDWQLTSPQSTNLTITDTSGITTYDFGLKPIVDFFQAQPTLTSAPTRCGFTVPFWLHYENTGTQTASGIVSLELDPLVTFVNASPAPDSIDGSQYFWFFQNLHPTYTGQVNLELLMPDVSFSGETIEMKSRVVLQEGGADVFESSHQFSSVINCSYDPNDKLVEPNIPGNSNYTLFGDTLIYTVRFQNTGTDTAINIRIEDVLDHNLDWSTFRVIAASHDYNVYLNENGRVEFFFNNIYLPDSTVSEIASHGFVKYRILAHDGLAENTIIDNFASIFFDFNPGILTNTVYNELVSEYPLELNVQSPLCHDSADGIVSVFAISPETVFYTWENGQTGTILTGLGAGEVSLTITNEAGQVVADTSVLIIAPASITLVASSTPANGTNADGTATVMTEGGTPPFSFEWNSQPIQTAETATGLLPGVYTIVATDVNGCTEQAEVTVEQATGVNETELKWQFSIRPNPSSGAVNIYFQLDRTAHWVLQVHNSAGQVIREFFAPEPGSSKADLLLENLDPGIYHLSLNAHGKILSKKLVVFEK